jgi:hypothetical protein
MTEKPMMAVIGAGLMGAGIALVFAAAGHRVALFDAMAEARATALPRIRDNLKAVGLDPAAAARVTLHPQLATAVADADFVIEAAPEDLALKQALFAEIEDAAKPAAVLASNTSVIPITSIMQRLRNKARALGTHWWNPPYLVPLVEVVRTVDTSDAAVGATLKLLASVGKTAVEVKKDVPGFIGNRLQHALWREGWLARWRMQISSAPTLPGRFTTTCCRRSIARPRLRPISTGWWNTAGSDSNPAKGFANGRRSSRLICGRASVRRSRLGVTTLAKPKPNKKGRDQVGF